MAPNLQPGDVFAGFRILRRLGEGGMGTVYAARHPRLPRDVALKLLQADPSDAGAAARFDREAEIIARLDHPGIVSVLDRGSEHGISWISIQLVAGRDAASELRRRGPLPLDAVLSYGQQVAEALDVAHRSGVIHRDVKPANIMLTDDRSGQAPRALLTDFGISTLTTQNAPAITGTLDVRRATVAYASPEQLRGESLDGRSDQYSLACTLYALLTGSQPFAGSSGVEIGTAHLEASVPSARSVRPDVPPNVDAAIARAMSKSREARFPTTVEFAEALRPQRGRGRTVLAAIVVTLLAVTATVGALMWNGSRGTQLPQASSTTVIRTPPSDVERERALWKQAQPGIALWPELLPDGPTAKGYQGMICDPTDQRTTSTKVEFTYVLRCTAREDGYGKPTVTVDLLSYAPGDADKALTALDPPPWVPRFPSSSVVRMYHFSEPEDGDWILLTFPAEERSDFHIQVGSEDGEMTYSQLFDWVVEAPVD